MTDVTVTPPGGMALLVQLEQAGALSSIGLHLADPELTYDHYEAIGALLGRMHESLRFAIGDWLLLGEQQFPTLWPQASEQLHLSEAGRQEYLRVSEKVPRSRRRKDLSWSHHRAVAALEPVAQKEWLKRASEENMSHHEMRDALRNGAEPKASKTCRCCGRDL